MKIYDKGWNSGHLIWLLVELPYVKQQIDQLEELSRDGNNGFLLTEFISPEHKGWFSVSR